MGVWENRSLTNTESDSFNLAPFGNTGFVSIAPANSVLPTNLWKWREIENHQILGFSDWWTSSASLHQ